MMQADSTFTVLFAAPVDTASLNAFLDILERRVPDGCKRLDIVMNSRGGQVRTALAFHRFLKTLPIAVAAYNIGAVDSAAIIPYLAAGTRCCTPGARFLVHPVVKCFREGSECTSLDLEDALREVRIDTDAVADILARNTARTQDFWLDAMSRQTCITATEAFRLGVATVPPAESIPAPGTSISHWAVVR